MSSGQRPQGTHGISLARYPTTLSQQSTPSEPQACVPSQIFILIKMQQSPHSGLPLQRLLRMNSRLTGLDFEGGDADNEHREGCVDTGPGEPHYYLTGLASASAGIKKPNRQSVVSVKTRGSGGPAPQGRGRDPAKWPSSGGLFPRLAPTALQPGAPPAPWTWPDSAAFLPVNNQLPSSVTCHTDLPCPAQSSPLPPSSSISSSKGKHCSCLPGFQLCCYQVAPEPWHLSTADSELLKGSGQVLVILVP